MNAVEIEQVSKSFGPVRALESVSLTVAPGEFFSLLGPSGCGKTTLLRLIAGLESLDSGIIRIGGQDVSSWPPQKRPVHTVFQSYALFPHLSVFDNVAFPLRMRHAPAVEVDRKVAAALELTHVADLRARRPHEISGGQKQRVALARALVNEPSVLLLDEPLAAIDAKLRKQLQGDLRALQRSLKITFIYVTHDQDEALSMSGQIAVMHQGSIEQIGPPREVYERPRTRFTASFLGACNLFPGALTSRNPVRVSTAAGVLLVSSAPCAAAQECVVGIRPEQVQIGPGDGVNCVTGTVREVVFSGARTDLLLEVAGQKVQITRLNNGPLAYRPGEQLSACFPPDALFVLA